MSMNAQAMIKSFFKALEGLEPDTEKRVELLENVLMDASFHRNKIVGPERSAQLLIAGAIMYMQPEVATTLREIVARVLAEAALDKAKKP